MKSLLVIQPFSLGDIVHGLQVVQSLAWVRPEWKISWVVSEELADLVLASPYVRETVIYPQKAGWGAWYKLRRTLETHYYDIVWDMPGVLRSGLLTAAVKAPEKWGRADARQCAGYFYNRRINAPAGTGPHHALDILQPFLRAAGVPQRLYFPLELKPGARQRWEGFFTGDPRNTFVLFTDSRKKEKAWPYFDELTALILNKIPDSRIAWCAMEKMPPDKVPEPKRFLNLTGCPFGEMIALVRQPATFIGNDSGPLQLSAATGNPVLALFGPTEPRQSGPYPVDAAKHQVVRAPGGKLAELQPATVLKALAELRQRSI